jgi:deoxyribonuclease IV
MFGSHLSIAGAMASALREAETLGLDCVQVFTKNQQQWKVPPLKPDAVAEWSAELARLAWSTNPPNRVVSHASYLANLASPDDTLREKSIALMLDELTRCASLGIPLLVFHPGAHTTATREEGLARVADACARLIRDTATLNVTLCLENVAGAGTTLGRTFEELADLRARVVAASNAPHRIGFCIDTCHAHAAGYDLSSRAKALAALAELDRHCGFANVHALHLNDSKGPAGSRLDRHEHIARGTIGPEGFAAFLHCEPLASRPKILETPKGPSPDGRPWDLINLDLLRQLQGLPTSTSSAKPPRPKPPAARSTPAKPAPTKPKRPSTKPRPSARSRPAR